MQRRRLLGGSIVVGAILVACGLDAIGGLTASDAGPGTPEAGNPIDGDDGDAPAGDASPDSDGPDLGDAALDANPVNCLAGCDGGTCDGGWCVIDCDTARGCTTDRVVCPPGIPCDVRCRGASACSNGVSCGGATACNVACTGDSACANGGVDCASARCRLDCAGASACAGGAACDGGSCSIACSGASACGNLPVACHGRQCDVTCGAPGNDGILTCGSGVDCQAQVSCDVRCRSRESCKNGALNLTAQGSAMLSCEGRDSCQTTIGLQARDAGVSCSGRGTCNNGIVGCDGGRCSAQCNAMSDPGMSRTVTYCCANPATCFATGMNGCVLTDAGCP